MQALALKNGGKLRKNNDIARLSATFRISQVSVKLVQHAVRVTKEATACGRTNHSPQSKEQSSERLGDIGAYKGGGRPPLVGGRTGAVDSSSPTHKGSINQAVSSVRGSKGLRPTAMIRRTSTRSFCVRLSIMLLVLQHLMAGFVVLM